MWPHILCHKSKSPILLPIRDEHCHVALPFENIKSEHPSFFPLAINSYPFLLGYSIKHPLWLNFNWYPLSTICSIEIKFFVIVGTCNTSHKLFALWLPSSFTCPISFISCFRLSCLHKSYTSFLGSWRLLKYSSLLWHVVTTTTIYIPHLIMLLTFTIMLHR